MIQGKTLKELVSQIEQDAENTLDMISPSRQMAMHALEESGLSLSVDGRDEVMPFTDTGHETLATRLNIPAAYYHRMREQAPSLLAKNVNTWLTHEGTDNTNRMVRTLNGRVRAILSDAYKRLDNYEFLNTVLPVLMDASEKDGLGLKVMSSEVTERRLYVQIVFEGIETKFNVNRHKMEVGEVVRSGLILKNSEIGMGCREINFLAYTLACKNGLVLPKDVGSFSSRHLGKRQGNGHAFELSQEAQEADAKAIALATRDAVQQMISRDFLQDMVDRMKNANTKKIIGPVEQSVRVLGKSFSLDQGEQENILKHLIDDGDLTHYGLTNAITRSAQDAKDYDRAITLEEVGGKFLYLPDNQLKPILEAKKSPASSVN